MHYIYYVTFGDLTGSTGGGGYNPNAPDPVNSNKPQQLIISIIIKVVVVPWQKVDETIDIYSSFVCAIPMVGKRRYI